MRTCTACFANGDDGTDPVASGATPRWGAPMSPFESTLSTFPSSPAPGPQPSPWAAGANPWGAVGGIGGQSQWQDTGNPWPSSPMPAQHNRDGFHSTAWHHDSEPTTPSMSGQPIGEGYFGGRPQTVTPSAFAMTPTNPYASPSQFHTALTPKPHAPLSLPLHNDAFAGYPGNGPASAPLPSPPTYSGRPRRAFSTKKAKSEDWYPPDPHANFSQDKQATRPRDWYQDFELHPSLLKKVSAPKSRSDVRGNALCFRIFSVPTPTLQNILIL